MANEAHGEELATIISYPTGASEIVVLLLKTPLKLKYSKTDPEKKKERNTHTLPYL